MRLAAVDVALTEAAIGSGLTGALLLRGGGAAATRDAGRAAGAASAASARARRPRRCCASVAASLAAGVLMLPDPGADRCAEAAQANLGATGLGNPVTAVLMAYRAIDTLLEKVVLVLALVGVWSLAPDALWGGRPGPRRRGGARRRAGAARARCCRRSASSSRSMCCGSAPTSPAARSRAATILAAMWLLVMMAGLADAPPLRSRALRACCSPVRRCSSPSACWAWLIAGAFLAYPPASPSR